MLCLCKKTNLSYASKIDGKMHACGHDGHTAGLLGAALILNELKDEFVARLNLCFSPQKREAVELNL